MMTDLFTLLTKEAAPVPTHEPTIELVWQVKEASVAFGQLATQEVLKRYYGIGVVK